MWHVRSTGTRSGTNTWPCGPHGQGIWVARHLLVALVWIGFAQPLVAQELSPRFYWPAPEGTKIVFVGYSYSFGDVTTDPSLPIFGVDSKINAGLLGYLQTLSLFGRTSNLLVEVPYVSGATVGTVGDLAARRDVAGLGDIGLTLSVNMLGAPSMNFAEFQALRAAPRQILGASIRVQVPTGAYDADRLVNISANRWASKAEVGYVVPLTPRWLLELAGGVWLFGDNDEFLGTTRAQEPVVSAEVHVVRRFRPGFWGSVDLNFFRGGRSTIAGKHRADLQRNSRFGGTVVVPFAGRYALKFGYSTGVVTESGDNFDSFLVGLQTLLP